MVADSEGAIRNDRAGSKAAEARLDRKGQMDGVAYSGFIADCHRNVINARASVYMLRVELGGTGAGGVPKNCRCRSIAPDDVDIVRVSHWRITQVGVAETARNDDFEVDEARVGLDDHLLNLR